MNRDQQKRNANIMAMMLRGLLWETIVSIKPEEVDGVWALTVDFGYTGKVRIYTHMMQGEIPIEFVEE